MQVASESSKKMAIRQAERNPNLPCFASNVFGRARGLAFQSPLLNNRVAGHVEVQAGQVNFRGSFPFLASNVLESMLHPA